MNKNMMRAAVMVTSLVLAGNVFGQTIFNGYAYTTSGSTPGISSTWYNLGGSAQSLTFHDADLGVFEDFLWLGGQTGIWSDGSGVASATLFYDIGGDATHSGSISYTFQSFSEPDDQWGTDVNGANATDLSVNLIGTHSLTPGNYTISVWVQGIMNDNDEVFDSRGGLNHTADFTVIPEPSSIIMMGLAGLAAGGLTVLKRRKQS